MLIVDEYESSPRLLNMNHAYNEGNGLIYINAFLQIVLNLLLYFRTSKAWEGNDKYSACNNI
jgi:hypothetical protein